MKPAEVLKHRPTVLSAAQRAEYFEKGSEPRETLRGVADFQQRFAAAVSTSTKVCNVIPGLPPARAAA
jgi:hypothetical protein